MRSMNSPPKAIVWVVDDDGSVTTSLRVLVEASGLIVETYDSVAGLLAGFDPERAGCIVLNEGMPCHRFRGRHVDRRR